MFKFQKILTTIIIPKIKAKLSEYENLLAQGKTVTWKVDLNYGGKHNDYDFSLLDYKALIDTHAEVNYSVM